jgi:hypothetical protein
MTDNESALDDEDDDPQAELLAELEALEELGRPPAPGDRERPRRC